MKGDVANATVAVVDATADSLVEEIKWAVVGAFAIAIASIFGLGAVSKKVFS